MGYRLPKRVELVNPDTQQPLVLEDGFLAEKNSRKRVAQIINDIPRFVSIVDNYAESFGWQWKTWEHNLSISRGPGVKHRELIMERTHFGQYDTVSKTILECGMGGGDDTEVLLTLPFAEIHSFDLSTSVERAKKYLQDERLFISQASIYKIPYPDQAFDFVFCHRVLQHTPDPRLALRCICKKVKPGGILFAHAYKRSKRHMQEWRYKYRWLTKRLPPLWIYWYVKHCGRFMHKLVHRLSEQGRWGAEIAYRFIPFYRLYNRGTYAIPEADAIELARMITFDALTPWHDNPMPSEIFIRTIQEEGFEIEHLYDSSPSPIYATARKL